MALLNTTKTTKEKWIEQIFNDYPDLQRDTLKQHYIEQMIDSYLADEAKFKKMTNELKSKGVDAEPKPVPDEIVCIERIEAEQPTQTVIEEVKEDN